MKDSYRLPGLHEQRLVAFEASKGSDDGMETIPIARRSARAPVHDQLLRSFANLRIQIVEQHAQRRFLLPAFARKRGSPRSAERPAARGRIIQCGYTSTHIFCRHLHILTQL
jgi:hypothetical protein